MTVESRSVVVRLSAETAQYIREMQTAGKVSADAMSKVEKSTMSASQAQDQLAGGAGKLGLAAAVGIGAVTSVTANFDQAMSKVQAATRETATGMDSLREAALEAGAETAFSASEAAGGIENLAKAGLSTQDILDGGLTGALDLAAAGEMAVADAAEAAAGALAQFSLDGDQAVHVADLLAAGAGKAQGDVSDMVLALKQAGTVSAQTGLSIEETVGALSAMAEQSLLGSDAGTSFKTMLAALTPNSKAAADAMAAYNINAFDAQGNFVGMTALAGQLQSGLKDLTDEQRAMALETIFGSDAVRAASIIYDNGAEGVAKWISQVDDSGFAAETAKTKLDNLKGDLEELGGAFETALIGTGTGSQGFLRDLTQNLTGAINAYNKLPSSAQSAVGTLLAGSAALGGSIWVGSKLIRGIADTREALDSLEASGSKATGVMKGLAKAGAGLAVLTVGVAAIKEIQSATEESLPGIDGMTGRLLDLERLGGAGFSTTLGEEFDSLGESIDRVADPGRITAASDGFLKLFTLDGAEIDGARQEVELLDQALANIVRTSGADAGEGALTALVEQGAITESQLKKVRGELTQYDEAMASAANETKMEAAAAADAAAATSELGDAMGVAAPLTKEQADALKEAREQAANTAGEFFNLGDSLDDSSVSLSGWITEMEQQANALENFTSNAKKAAKNGLRDGLIAALEDAGPAGALRLKQLANASDEEITRANKAWKRGQDAIDAYVDSVVKVPGSKTTTLDLKSIEATARLIAYRNSLDAATKDRIHTITTVYKVVRSATDALPDRTQRKATGGLILGPGTTTSDSIPALLSNKEYVIQAAAVEEYGVGFFDAANAMRLAGGGSTDRKRTKSTASAFAPPAETEAEQRRRERREAEQERRDRNREAAEEQARAAEEEQREREQAIADAVLAGQQRAWDAATDAAKAQVDAAQSMVDTVKANMDRLGTAATAAFQSPLFSSTQQRGLFVGGDSSSGWRGALEGDIAGLQERSSIITSLSDPSLGLSPQALEALLGQADNAQIQAMLAAGEVDDYAALFAERLRLTGEVSTQAGMAGYGQEYAAASAQLVQTNEKLDLLTAIIAAARPITVTETVSAAAMVAEMARLQAAAGGF